MNLCIVRHGETEWNAARRLQGQHDIPLSEKGIEQARELGKKLASEFPKRFVALYCSPLARARQTAQHIGMEIGLAPVPIQGLHEVCLGAFETHTWEEVKADMPEAFEDFNANMRFSKLHGGESMQEVASRALDALAEIMERHSDAEGDVLIVSHGAVIASIRTLASDGDMNDMRTFIPHNAELVELTLDSVEFARAAL